MSGQPAWVGIIYYGGGATVCVAYLVAFVVLTARSRASIRSAQDLTTRQAIAGRWVKWLTRANVAVYLAVLMLLGFMLATVEDGWKGAWLPLLLLGLLWPLRRLALKQNALYAKLFLGVDLSAQSPGT